MARKIGTEILVVVVALGACAGCRAVIGIEDLRRDDASVADASVADSNAPDVVTGDGGDATPPPDGGGPTLATCNAYCRTDGGNGAGAAAFSNEMRSCMCQGSALKACTSECVGLCPSGTPPSANCEACMLQQALDGGVCASKVTNCTSPCQTFFQCVKDCL